ncbi:hypothetical protein KKF70_07710 [bacterium]|nr:hypothetical protein [bacterium]
MSESQKDTSNKYRKFKFSIALALVHFFVISIWSVIYFISYYEKFAQHQFFWMYPLIFDMPMSIIFTSLSRGNMIFIAISHAVLGTIQYAVIGWLIDLSISKKRWKEMLPSKGILTTGILIIMIFATLCLRNFLYIRLSESEKSQIELNKAKSEHERYHALNDAAKSHFEDKKYDKARTYANELLILAEKQKTGCNYGDAIYDSHLILGRLAVLDNDITAAKNHLLSAVKTPGSPTLNSFGPNMSLAKDLLEKGQKESVIKFLNECKKFWDVQCREDKIGEWIEEIENDKIPNLME